MEKVYQVSYRHVWLYKKYILARFNNCTHYFRGNRLSHSIPPIFIDMLEIISIVELEAVMFTFNFEGGSSDTTHPKDSNTLTAVPLTERVPSEVHTDVKWIDFSTKVDVEGVELTVVDPVKVVDHMKTSGLTQLVTLRADRVHSDLIPGAYEGGMKIWESTFDLGSLLLKIVPNVFKNKSVLDLGCGSGLLGILALKIGCKTAHFHDYNSEASFFLTIPNVSLNGDYSLNKSEFWCGDWEHYGEASSTKFDLILISETIYNAGNNKKLHDVVKSKLNSGGAAYVAGKSYYFGVGGSMKGFREVVVTENVLNVTSIWSEKGNIVTGA